MKELANKIALVIAQDIRIRSGLRAAFDLVSPTVRIEMLDTWTAKIEEVLTKELQVVEPKEKAPNMPTSKTPAGPK